MRPVRSPAFSPTHCAGYITPPSRLTGKNYRVPEVPVPKAIDNRQSTIVNENAPADLCFVKGAARSLTS